MTAGMRFSRLQNYIFLTNLQLMQTFLGDKANN